MIRIIEGVIIVKDGKGWGVTHSDGSQQYSGWVDIDKATIHNPRYCRKPTDATYKGSSDEKHLKGASFVRVKKTISTTITLEFLDKETA